MHHLIRTWATLGSLSLWGLSAQAEEPNAPPPARSCVAVAARTRYSMGYDHLVDLTCNCAKSVRCEVKTNVNPEVHPVELAPKESTTVVTYLGSPAREFTPEVNCSYR